MEPIVSKLQSVADFLQHDAQFSQIPGFLLNVEGYLLMLLAQHGPGAGEIVEIGSFMGKSTCWLAAGSAAAKREKVTAIDTFQGSAEHLADPNLREVLKDGKLYDGFCYMLVKHNLHHQVSPVVGDSHAVSLTWGKPIRLLFIDGDHSYAGVKRDFADWERHVVPGGMVCLHDVDSWDGVTEFYTKDMKANPNYRETIGVNSLRAFTKRA
jgi:predicted O-methyltransferase YrrM